MNKISHETLKQAAAMHQATIRQKLQYRLEMARQKGDENLIRILEAEASYFS